MNEEMEEKGLRLWLTVTKFVQIHDDVSDESLIQAGEVLMDGRSFLKIRKAYKEYFEG